MQIAILSRAGDPLSRCLAQRIGELREGTPPSVLSLELDAPVSMDSAALWWGEEELSLYDSVWLSGFGYLDPVVPQEAGAQDWSVWDARYVAHQQRFSALYSLLSELERRGVTLLNPPLVHVQNWIKANQLQRLAAAGFDVPRLLCTNEDGAAAEFCRTTAQVLWRPVTGRAVWQRFRDKQREHLLEPGRPPILLAEGAEGTWQRIWVMQGEPLLALGCAAPGLRPLAGAEGQEEDTGGQRFLETLESFSLLDGAEHAQLCAGLARELGARWFVLTAVACGEGLRLYDIDPDPSLDWLPAPYQAWLLERIARRLAGVEDPLDQKCLQGLPAKGERPALFLRRMLQILFDMEQSKYPEEEADGREIEP